MKKGTILLLVLSLFITLTAVPAAAEGADPAVMAESAEAAGVSAVDPSEAVYLTLYFADTSASPSVQGGRRIAELVREATRGRVQFEVVAGSGFDEREMLKQVMDGELDIAACGNSVLTNVIPQMGILDQAYLWESAEAAHAAVDGRLGELIRESAEAQNFHIIGVEDAGFCSVFSTQPVLKTEDFKTMRIRRMENPGHREAFEALGATLVPVAAAEVKEAMREGTIGACESAAVNLLSAGYYEVARNVILTQHAFEFEVLCMSDSAWERIPQELRGAVLAAVEEGVAWERERLEEADRETVQELGMLGISFYSVDTAECREMVRRAAEGNAPEFDEAWQAAVEEAIASVNGE